MTATRILIVDDARHVREELRNLLQLDGDFQVVGEAADGLEAITLAQALQPDVILMDMEMPVLDGFEATRQIKAMTPACRVVALTVYGSPDVRGKAAQAGVDTFVEKGEPVERLVRAIFGKKE